MYKTVLIVDDESDIRELLRLYLEKNGYHVLEAENGVEGLAHLAANTVDIVLVDIMMPEMNGYQMIERLRKDYGIPVIILSAKGAGHEKILGLDIGADDYVVKPFDPLEVLARINAQLRRRAGEAQEEQVLMAGRLQLDVNACSLFASGQEIVLTSTEFGMMFLFMSRPGRVFTKQQIYEAAWKKTSIVDDNTIMVAISKLRAKLSQDDNVQIKTIRGLGYRLEVHGN